MRCTCSHNPRAVRWDQVSLDVRHLLSHLRSFSRRKNSLCDAERISLGAVLLHSRLSTQGGIYRITSAWAPEKTLYVGKAKNIRQRIYSNLMKGQMRSHTFKRKLDKDGRCDGNSGAKAYLARNCYVQFILEPDARLRSQLEHYVIAALLPKFND